MSTTMESNPKLSLDYVKMPKTMLKKVRKRIWTTTMKKVRRRSSMSES